MNPPVTKQALWRAPASAWLVFWATLASACALPKNDVQVPSAARSAENSGNSGACSVPFTLTVVGTSDLHGHLEALPLLGGYLDILRDLRSAAGPDHGEVVLLDGGDMFQGTLESNAEEGLPVVQAYGLLGYQAVTIGNHEFDYGPLGPEATPKLDPMNPFGALVRNAQSARFPMLAANLISKDGSIPAVAATKPAVVLRLPQREPSGPGLSLSAAGSLPTIQVGLVGVTTRETLKTTISANVAGLTLEPLREATLRNAQRLRASEQVDLVLLLAHAGGQCKRPTGGDYLSDLCNEDEEIVKLVKELPPKTVDGIVAGHTHAAMASIVAGTPVIESHSYGRAFGRIDYVLSKAVGAAKATVCSVKVHPPQFICGAKPGDPARCAPPPYEGKAVSRTRSTELVQLVERTQERAKAAKARELGPTLRSAFQRSYDHESALGNLFADLLLAHAKAAMPPGLPPKAPMYPVVSLINGGALRENLPAGVLHYGAL
jgi:2',3'-cyclic-nucleotide 2'-phosphodiesterase (5'-nucleotidase family)